MQRTSYKQKLQNLQCVNIITALIFDSLICYTQLATTSQSSYHDSHRLNACPSAGVMLNAMLVLHCRFRQLQSTTVYYLVSMTLHHQTSSTVLSVEAHILLCTQHWLQNHA